ncbi:TetR/AcrR family transcriptional regulator [Bacillus massiliigorillae]|uniref:TetR/AcrR family transcriptional regulator n=1 Tax=Bacillus massiliigorillae TaxID=1243664 RepID=UPI0003A807CB|nr:TetR/AcrR family transcriptional regulator [Bacillus massiliigorillae]
MAIDRKQLIIEAATKSFSLFGYKATTMDQVAKLANVGKGTIYNFFTNKEQLFQEIVHSLILEIKSAAEESLKEDQNFHENLQAALNQILEYRTKHQFMMKLFEEEREMGTPAVAEMVNRIELAIIAYIQEKVEIAVNKGEITVYNSEVSAFLMYKVYKALIFDWEKNHEPLKKEEIAKIFQNFIFKGLSNY